MTNVVLIHTDDTGRYIGPYGHDVATPALDELADEGVCYRSAYTAGPTCSPSRSAVMTGRPPHVNGMLGLAHRGFSLDDPERHLATHLSGHGYETVLAGQQHEAHVEDGTDYDAAREVLGYDRTLERDQDSIRDLPIDHDLTRTDLATADAAASYIDDHDQGDDPFFLSVGLDNTHKPLPLEQNLVDPDGVAPPGPLPDVPAVREETAALQVAVSYVDECVARVVGALRNAGLLDETLVVFTTDHGVPLPFMKCTLFDDGIGIALLARFPDGHGAGQTNDELVSNLDLYPTICETLDVPVPAGTAGRSLRGVTDGSADWDRDAVYAEVNYHAAYEPKRCVRTDRYKYIRRFDDEYTCWIPANIDAGPSKSFVVGAGLLDRERPQEALYDCHLDPAERENLIDDPDYADVRADLTERLDDWMERTDDPLLTGPISKPDGALADSRNAMNPDEGDWEPTDAR